MTDANWVAKTIKPKSDQLNAEDLLTGPITVTVMDVRQGSEDQPVAICIEGLQPYKPCKTMRRVLVRAWGERAVEWIGRRLTLFADPDVKWGGVTVGGIRISHLSHIDQTLTLMLSESKAKRKAITVKPIVSAPAVPETLKGRWQTAFRGAPKPVLTIMKKIADAYGKRDINLLSDVEPEAAQIENVDWRNRLTLFASEVASELTSSALLDG